MQQSKVIILFGADQIHRRCYICNMDYWIRLWGKDQALGFVDEKTLWLLHIHIE